MSIHPEANLWITGGAGEPSGAGGRVDGTSNCTTTEELLPGTGMSWKISLANPATQLVVPLGVHSSPS